MEPGNAKSRKGRNMDLWTDKQIDIEESDRLMQKDRWTENKRNGWHDEQTNRWMDG